MGPLANLDHLEKLPLKQRFYHMVLPRRFSEQCQETAKQIQAVLGPLAAPTSRNIT